MGIQKHEAVARQIFAFLAHLSRGCFVVFVVVFGGSDRCLLLIVVVVVVGVVVAVSTSGKEYRVKEGTEGYRMVRKGKGR